MRGRPLPAYRRQHRPHFPNNPPFDRERTRAVPIGTPRTSRPGKADHLATLPGITVLDLDLQPPRPGTTPGRRHTAGIRPNPPLTAPTGRVIATTAPDRWTGEPVRVLDLTPLTPHPDDPTAKTGSAGLDETVPASADGLGPVEPAHGERAGQGQAAQVGGEAGVAPVRTRSYRRSVTAGTSSCSHGTARSKARASSRSREEGS